MKPWRKLYASILDSDSLYSVSSDAIVLLAFLIVAQDDSGYYPWTPVKIERLITSRPTWDIDVATQYAKELAQAGVLSFLEGGVVLTRGKELNGITRKDVAEELYLRKQGVNVTLTERTRAVRLEGEGEETQREKEIRQPIRADSFELPEWIDKETWQDFIEMRKKKRASPTLKAKQLLVANLGSFRDVGGDIKAILEQSIVNNWTDVYPLRSTNGTVKGYSKAPAGAGGEANKYRAEAERLGIDPSKSRVSQLP